MIKHTAAPWHQGGYEVQDDKGALICNLSGWRGEQQTLANARLIAAAPELLEALKLAYRYALDNADQEYPFDWAIYCEALYQAIAKAEGESK
jgi:hypothetical protein